MEKAIQCLTKKYADFSGRASRSEYWYFALLIFSANIILTLVDVFTGTYNAKAGFGLLDGLFMFATIIPNISVNVRRLHDIDKSGLWMFILLIPIVGPIWLIILCCIKGTEGTNRFEEDPLQT